MGIGMITVKVKYTSILATILGTEEENVELQQANVGALIDKLLEKYTSTRSNESPISFSIVVVNGQQARPETMLHNGDEVALLPPLAGG